MLHSLLSKFDLPTADAHCDIPCGIYDARIVTYYAVSALRQMDILLSLEDKGLSHTAFAMQAARNTAKKEEMAENCKHQTRIIWGDFMKGDHLKKHPGAHELAHKIMLAGSAVKQDLHREDGEKLVALCNEFAEMFWDMKGVKTKRVTTPYAPNVEVVEPDL
jgi:nickel superoxide dismutase